MKEEILYIVAFAAIMFSIGLGVGSAISHVSSERHAMPIYAVSYKQISVCHKTCQEHRGIDSVTLTGECVCRDGAQHFMEELP